MDLEGLSAANSTKTAEKLRSAAFPESSENRLGLLLMNLEIHGCTGVAEANWLCALGMAAPSNVVRHDAHGQSLAFEAIELELTAILETGKILAARAVKHPFIAEAFARMEDNQFADDSQVVFSVSHMGRFTLTSIELEWRRSAVGWRR